MTVADLTMNGQFVPSTHSGGLFVVLAVEGCLPSALLGLVDVLQLAREILGGKGGPAFDLRLASEDGLPVRDGYGRAHAVDCAVTEIERCGAILIPGFVPDKGMQPPRLEHHRVLAAWIRAQHSKGAIVCGSCSGTFMLGEAGLLDGRDCTTTWWLHDVLCQRYPRANARWGAPLIEDGRVVTVGGPMSWIDCALHVLRERLGPEAARLAADFAVVDMAPSSQAAYIPAGYLAARNPLVAEAEHHIRRMIAQPPSARTLAKALGLSERTLHRRLQLATGETPKAMIDRLRFDIARDMLERGDRTVKEIAGAVGFRDDGSFRRSFMRIAGITPVEWRSRMRSVG